MHQPYTPPTYDKSAFHCPHCGAFSVQKWGHCIVPCQAQGSYPLSPGYLKNLSVALCAHCGDYSLWLSSKSKEKMIYPHFGMSPLPSPDLPEHIVQDYLEARDIVARSPRGAAALLRLCIQKLCIHLGEAGKDLNSDIGALVRKGLNPKIQKSLDIVRVIGNESVHPGTVDVNDDPQIAAKLFVLINIIVDALITQPKMIEDTYEIIPEVKRSGIERRDGKC